MSNQIPLTGTERFFDITDIIVSKTDLKGKITYANHVFLEIAGYTEHELIGAPHSIVRHPDMPRCVFKLLWDTIEAGSEIFAYVINRCKNGDHYWVYAHVTPTYDQNGKLISYHSNRRVPDASVVQDKIVPLYKTLLDIENQHSSSKDGMAASFSAVVDLLGKNNISYDQFIQSLAPA